MDKNETINTACRLIADNLGEYTANMYRDFYENKDEALIKNSVKELLVELIGQQSAEKQISQYFNK